MFEICLVRGACCDILFVGVNCVIVCRRVFVRVFSVIFHLRCLPGKTEPMISMIDRGRVVRQPVL